MHKVSDSVEEYVANQHRYEASRRFLRGLTRTVGSLLVDAESSGLEHIPDSGGAIIMMNHTSFLDPIICMGLITNRFVIPMSKAENRNKPVISWLINMYGVYYVNREIADRQALNAAIELLKHGQVTLIAPEGTRHPEGLAPAKDGMAYIASKSDALIIPTAVCDVADFKQRWKRLRRAHAVVRFGKPFRFKRDIKLNRETRGQMMREAMYQLALAIPDEYASLRGHYSDSDNATTDLLDFNVE